MSYLKEIRNEYIIKWKNVFIHCEKEETEQELREGGGGVENYIFYIY